MVSYFNIKYEMDPARIHELLDEYISTGRPEYICGADGNILQMVHRDPEYRKVVSGAAFSICDSSWVPLFLRLLYGIRVSQYCGSQIFDYVTRQCRYRQFFLGTTDDVLSSLKCNLVIVDSAISSMTFQALPFRDVEDFDYPAIADAINNDKPDVIWVSLGAPKQERFMSMLKPYLKTGVMIGVGAVFNFRSGLGEKRAPQWMINAHLEWLYRIFKSPGKQLRRCWQIITTFPAIYRDELRRSRR